MIPRQAQAERRASLPTRWTQAACVAALVLAVSPAGAVEREWHLGLGGGLASTSQGTSWAGYGFGAHAAYGLNDSFDALLQVDACRFPSARSWVLGGAVGVAYTIDITEWIPYVAILGGAYRVAGDDPVNAPGAQAALGLDYRLNRVWAVGVQLRYHSIFAAEPIGRIDQTTTFLRLERLWGW